MINMTSMRELQGDDPDGSVHECLHIGCTCMQRMHKNQILISVGKERQKIIGIMDIHPEMFHEAEILTVLLCDCCGRQEVSYHEQGGSEYGPGQTSSRDSFIVAQ